MNNKHRYQCQVCGNLQWSEIPFYIEDELFTNLKCGHCKRETNHLYVGDESSDDDDNAPTQEEILDLYEKLKVQAQASTKDE